MDFTCIGTSSRGNCYLVKTDGSNILLDAGIPLKIIIKKINLNYLSFAFISHEHKDHSEAMNGLISHGVQVIYGGLAKAWKKQKINKGFDGNIYTFGVEHGEAICNAIIIETKKDTILYATDFNICKWDLSMFEFTSVIVECNFIEENITQAMIDSDPKFKRQINTHLGLYGVDLFLSGLNLRKCKEIILCHQSTDPKIFDQHIVQMHVFSKYLIPVGVCQVKGGVEWFGKDEFEL